jgi:hypothetical protein
MDYKFQNSGKQYSEIKLHLDLKENKNQKSLILLLFYCIYLFLGSLYLFYFENQLFVDFIYATFFILLLLTAFHFALNKLMRKWIKQSNETIIEHFVFLLFAQCAYWISLNFFENISVFNSFLYNMLIFFFLIPCIYLISATAYLLTKQFFLPLDILSVVIGLNMAILLFLNFNGVVYGILLCFLYFGMVFIILKFKIY